MDKPESPINKPVQKAPAKGARPVVLIGSVAVIVLLVVGVTIWKHSGKGDSATKSDLAAPEGSLAAKPDSSTAPLPKTSITSQPQLNRPSGDKTAAVVRSGANTDILKLITTLNDPAISLAEKKKAIKALAQDGSPAAVAALKQALTSGSKELRAAVANGMGDCSSAECAKMLTDLLNDPSLDVARAAIQGLSQQGSPQAVDALTKLLNDPSRAADLRIDAADGLGSINQPGVLDALSNAALTIQDEDIVTQVLNALGTRDFSETQSFFNNYLHSPSVSSDMRVAAIEALGQAQGSPTDFLVGLASDGDPDVRVAAAWALSTTEETGKAGAQLLSLLQGESDPDVRIRLYQALSNQEGYDTTAALNAIRNEKDPAALVAGLDLLAKTLRDNPNKDLQAYFDQIGFAQLKNLALSTDGSSQDRIRPVIALARSGSPGALSALQDIYNQSTDPRVKQAAGSAAGNIARK